MHLDHEVQMARKDCYAAADDAIALHKLLRNVSEQQGLEGWVAAKITLASDYLNTVREHLEYQLMSQGQPDAMTLPIAEGSTNDYFKRRKDEEDRIAGTKAPTKRTPKQTDYEKKRKQQDVAEGYYDLNDDGMQPIDLSANPSFKEIVNRYTQLVYQGHASETSPEEDQEYDAIEAYVAKRFGETGSAHLQKAGEVSYWGRDDKPYGRDSRGSNLGRPNQPVGDFRTTKAGKMHGQDAKVMKNKVSDRLGRHPAPNLPEGISENVSGGTSSAGSVATVNNPGGKPKSQVGSLFGGTYQRKKKTTSK
jgi:hypothetical protein